MRVKFWGVRGSIPSPMTVEKFQGKVSAIIQRITPADLKSAENREKFMAGLPEYIFSGIGGNTTCIEISHEENSAIIVDAGTGLRVLGKQVSDSVREFHIFLTHFHWDHIQGFPFFAPAYDPDCRITFYSPVEDFHKLLDMQMMQPFFPVRMENLKARINFFTLREPFTLGNTEISFRKVLHPGGCFSYKFVQNGKSLIVSTDTELKENDFQDTDENMNFYQDSDMIVLDAQYTMDEAVEKRNWGHSSGCLGADFVGKWNIGKFVLFHFDPDYDDRKIYDMLESVRWYSAHVAGFNSQLVLAREGLVLEV